MVGVGWLGKKERERERNIHIYSYTENGLRKSLIYMPTIHKIPEDLSV